MSDDKKKNNKVIKVLLSIIVVGILCLAVYMINGLTHISTDDAYITGRVHSIAPKISGTVKALHIQDNQDVKKGDILVEIDPVDYELKVNEAAAMAGVRQASFDQAGKDRERAEALYKDAVFSKEKYEMAVTAYNLAKAQLDAANEQQKIAQKNLGYTKIYAPADGYITNRSVEEGNQVQPGQPLLAIVALDDIWIVANYKETQLKSVKPGQPVRIKVDTYPDKVFTGKVDSIMAGTGAAFSLFPVENAMGNYVKVVQRIPVKITFDSSTRSNRVPAFPVTPDTDNEHKLRIGMSCVPTINTK